MKELILNKLGYSKLMHNSSGFSQENFEDLQSSYIPGEWILISNKVNSTKYIGFINLHATVKNKIIHLVSPHFFEQDKLKTEDEWAVRYITNFINKAIIKRDMLYKKESKRLCYGDTDNLPGLIIDEYENCLLVAINTAGIDRFRKRIEELLKSKFSQKKIIFLDNEKNRASECLPVYESPSDLVDTIEISENNFSLKVTGSTIQKVGYYFDHRENRLRLENSLLRLNIKKESGLDLFCYCGTWGLHLLRSGVKQVEFVDQANMEKNIVNNVENNKFSKNSIKFNQESVFSFIEKKISENKKYNVVVCDPPAFAKTQSQKMGAISGYQKLYKNIFKILEPNAVLAVCSCTSYVTYEDLDDIIQDASRSNNRNVILVDLGMQGLDHPVPSLKSKSNYLKYLLYIVE